jgi:hypothetical protein
LIKTILTSAVTAYHSKVKINVQKRDSMYQIGRGFFFVILLILLTTKISWAANFAIPPKFSYAGRFSDGVALVRLNDEWFYIDKSGKAVIKPQKFEKYEDFKEGLAVVSTAGKYGYIDKTGKLAIPLRFGTARSFRDGRAVVGFGPAGATDFGVIDRSGNFIVNPHFDKIWDFNNGIALVDFERTGYIADASNAIDIHGKRVFRPNFFSIKHFNEGHAAALLELNGRWGLLKRDGSWAVNPRFNSLHSPKGGLSVFGECEGQTEIGTTAKPPECKYGYIDLLGNVKIPPQFRYAQGFQESRALVSFNLPARERLMFNGQLGVTFGYIDKTGKLVIDSIYSEAHDFAGGVALVRESFTSGKQGDWGFIGRDGKPLTEFIYVYATSVSEGFAAVMTKSGKMGYLKF